MRKLSKGIAVLLASLLAAGMLAACGGTPSSASAAPSSTPPAISTSAPASGSDTPSESVTFTDSAGREVEIPKNIGRIAPSGAIAQLVLYTLCPDLIVGWSSEFSGSQKEYIDEKYWSLPTFGRFYGKDVTLNKEALIATAPDIIIDVGEAKGSIREDMDMVQEQTGIPVIFIEASLESLAQAYTTLGELTGSQTQAEKLSAYITETLAMAEENRAKIADGEQVSVYYGLGESGLEANATTNPHGAVLPIVGAVNVAEIDQQAGGGDEISMEQLLVWNPDVILLDPKSAYEAAQQLPEWQNLAAVQSGEIYEVPIGPYNWMGRPPSVNQILGIRWLGNLLYPELYNYDIIEEAKTFYDLFYHYTLSDEQAEGLLANSTLKAA